MANRWIVVLGSIIMQLSLGAIYTWSLFNAPLVETFGWDPGATVFTFSVTLVCFALAINIAGSIQDKIGPRKVATAGGILTGLGVAASAFATTPTMLYITYGIIAGLGIGAAYVTPLASCIKWFPEKRGLITGLVLAALGVGGMVFKPIILWFIMNVGVSTAFLYLGMIYGALIITGAQLLAVPPADYKPPGWSPPAPAWGGSFVPGLRNFTMAEAIKTPQLYMLFLWMYIVAASGLMVISVAANIGIEMAGLSLATAGNAVVSFSLFNAAGRLGLGGISDRFGRRTSIMFIFVLMGLGLLILSLTSLTYATLLLATCMVGFAFGGMAPILPTLTAEWFGTVNVGNNYGTIFIFYALAALTAPRLPIAIGFEAAFLVGASACALGFAVAFMSKPPKAHLGGTTKTTSARK